MSNTTAVCLNTYCGLLFLLVIGVIRTKWHWTLKILWEVALMHMMTNCQTRVKTKSYRNKHIHIIIQFVIPYSIIAIDQ